MSVCLSMVPAQPWPDPSESPDHLGLGGVLCPLQGSGRTVPWKELQGVEGIQSWESKAELSAGSHQKLWKLEQVVASPSLSFPALKMGVGADWPGEAMSALSSLSLQSSRGQEQGAPCWANPLGSQMLSGYSRLREVPRI